MGKLLDSEHVLLIGVQHVTGMWVLRALRMRQYFLALKVEQADAERCNAMENALKDAQQLAVDSPSECLAVHKASRKSATGVTVAEWAREIGKWSSSSCVMASRKLWAKSMGGWHGGSGHATTTVCCWW